MIQALISLALGMLIISSNVASAEERSVVLTVDNMYCEACPYMVKKTIERVSGVSKVTVSFKEKTAAVIFDDAKTDVTAITRAAAKAGFPSALKS